MDLNKPITSTKNNFGLTSLIGGILQVIFGFSLSFVGLAIFAIAVGAGVKSLSSEKDDNSRTKKAKVGIGLAVVMAVLWSLGFSGIVGMFLS